MSIARDLSQLRTPIQTSLGGTGNDGNLTSLATGVNWDTIASPGEYFVPAASGSNAPVSGVNFIVEVTSTSIGLKQVASQYASAVIYSRAVVSGSWSAWAKSFDTNNIVGAVSQTSGVPTGAIIQSGAGNGARWIRYADGTQIIWGSYAAGVLTYSGPYGSIYTANSPQINYPVSFVGDGPVFNIQVVAANADVWASGGQAGQPLTYLPAVLLFAPTAGNRNTIITYTAHGRWY